MAERESEEGPAESGAVPADTGATWASSSPAIRRMGPDTMPASFFIDPLPAPPARHHIGGTGTEPRLFLFPPKRSMTMRSRRRPWGRKLSRNCKDLKHTTPA